MSSGWTVSAELEADRVRDTVARLRDDILPEARQSAVQGAMQAGLAAAIEATPVDTARSRAAWAAALQELGGEPPAGWTGSHPSDDAINEGAALGAVSHLETVSTTELRVENGVPYLPLVEYGTHGQPPRNIVRAGLTAAQSTILNELRAALNL